MELSTTKESKVMSVGQLTHSIKAILEGSFGIVSVRGEISNFRPASSGHIYFSLKDNDATISAALFRGSAMKQKNLVPKDGMEVICHGKISVYPPRGTYQIIVESIEPVGAGSLQAAFEMLKKKLFAEGLFDSARKRPIPAMPTKIVVITSPTGAAIRDVLSVLKRRFSGVQVLIIPALVQGDAAPPELMAAIKTANEYELGDVILLTRGGGSLEDLWCFNHEGLAREIVASKIPVVSAVGHEIDFTIADFVADLRAPTPSAAAEILVKEKTHLVDAVKDLEFRLIKSMRAELNQWKLSLQALASKLKNPKDRINDLRIRFDDWNERLISAMKRSVERRKEKLQRVEASLNALSPLRVLDRGYSLVYAQDGTLLKEASKTKAGAEIRVQFSKGSVSAEVL